MQYQIITHHNIIHITHFDSTFSILLIISPIFVSTTTQLLYFFSIYFRLDRYHIPKPLREDSHGISYCYSHLLR